MFLHQDSKLIRRLECFPLRSLDAYSTCLESGSIIYSTPNWLITITIATVNDPCKSNYNLACFGLFAQFGALIIAAHSTDLFIQLSHGSIFDLKLYFHLSTTSISAKFLSILNFSGFIDMLQVHPIDDFTI